MNNFLIFSWVTFKNLVTLNEIIPFLIFAIFKQLFFRQLWDPFVSHLTNFTNDFLFINSINVIHRIKNQLCFHSTELLTQSLMFARFSQVSRRKSIERFASKVYKLQREDETTMTEGQGRQSSKWVAVRLWRKILRPPTWIIRKPQSIIQPLLKTMFDQSFITKA